MKSGKIGWQMAWEAALRDFADRYFDYRVGVDLQTIDAEYDFCVVGSDQVWNPLFGDFWQFFLDFVPREKRISYAASISTPVIPEELQERYCKGLLGMQTLSVREQAGAKLIRELTGREAQVHVDPTLLLSAEKWRKVSRPPAWEKETKDGYLLTYFLGKRPPEVDAIARELGLPVINLLDEEAYTHFVTGVEGFLWAFDHASLVYTDSFHGTVFSILFETPFVVTNRVGSGADDALEKMGSRIDTLLGLFGFEGRRARQADGYRIAGDPLTPPDWSRCAPVLERERARSDAYLRAALSVEAEA